MNKNTQLLAYLTKGHPEASVTVLIKLCYLADLISVQRGASKISTFNYIRYNYGPFDRKIYEDLDSLLETGFVIPVLEYTKNGAEAVIYRFNEEKSSELNMDEFNKSELGILDELLDSVRGYGAKALTEIAYNTKPMQALNATLGGTENLGKVLDLSIS